MWLGTDGNESSGVSRSANGYRPIWSTPCPWHQWWDQPLQEEEAIEDSTTIRPKLHEEEPIEEHNPEEEAADEGDLEEQWVGDEDLEEVALDQEAGKIPIEEPDMEGNLAVEEEPKPEVARWNRGSCGSMCRGTCPLDAPRQ